MIKSNDGQRLHCDQQGHFTGVVFEKIEFIIGVGPFYFEGMNAYEVRLPAKLSLFSSPVLMVTVCFQ